MSKCHCNFNRRVDDCRAIRGGHSANIISFIPWKNAQFETLLVFNVITDDVIENDDWYSAHWKKNISTFCRKIKFPLLFPFSGNIISF